MIETRSTQAQLRWRPSPLTLAILTCAVVGLAVAVIGSLWQLVAFAAPLIGVLCSIGWQRPVPAVEVHAEPGTHRCFETEQARVTVWAAAEAESDSDALDLTVSVVPGMRIESAETESRGRRPSSWLRTGGAGTRSRAGSPSVREAGCCRARASSTPPTSSCSRWRRRSRRRFRGPTCSTVSAPTSPGTSARASSTPTSAGMCPAITCARSTGR